MDKAFGVMRIAAKAGKLILGEDAVSSAAAHKRIRIVICAEDAGASTQRRAQRAAETASVPLITLPCGRAELGFAVGRGQMSVAAFTDAGLAASFMEKLSAGHPEAAEYREAAAALSDKAESINKRRSKSSGSTAAPKRTVTNGGNHIE